MSTPLPLTSALSSDLPVAGGSPLAPSGSGAGSAGAGLTAAADHLAMRASDAERQQTIGHLKQACVEGRLTLDEFGERVKSVHAARTWGDLAVITRDLPAVGQVGTALPGAPAPLSPPTASVSPAAQTALGPSQPMAAPARPPVATTVAIMSSSERGGTWHVGRDTRVVAVMGSCKLDLRHAIISAPVVAVEAWIVMGSLEVIVPPGVHVDVDALTVAGSKMLRLSGPRPEPDAPIVRVGGVVIMGSVTVRDRPSLGERISAALQGPQG